MLTEQLRQIFM